MRFRPPANVLIRRAQLVLILAALIPTVLMTSLGIILLASGVGSIGVVAGTLVLALCTSSLTGYILGSIFLARGASLARIQHDFLSAVSHELRTPITSIRVFIDTLRAERVTDPTERKNCLEIMDRELARLDGLVGKLHELSRIESGKTIYTYGPVDVTDIVADALAAFDAVKLGGDARVETHVQPGLAVHGDRAALSQAVANLLSNAYKYTGPSKEIVVTAARTGRDIEIVVADNGPGIATDEQNRIFEPFERGHAAITSRTSGSGLGLAIVRAIVRSHRGRVEVTANMPQGARFRILLPRPA